MTDLQKLADRLDDAMKAFANENGDGFGNRDHLGARDYRDDGFALADNAMERPAEQREGYVQSKLDVYPEFGLDVTTAAAWYRIAELSK